MDHFKKYTQQVQWLIFFYFLLLSAVIIVLITYLPYNRSLLQLEAYVHRYLTHTGFLVIVSCIAIVLSLLFSLVVTYYIAKPMRLIWNAVLHVSPEHTGTAPPNLSTSRIGRELVNSLALQVYQFASAAGTTTSKDGKKVDPETIIHAMPLPVVATDKDQTIIFASDMLGTYIGQPTASFIGKNIYDILNFSFPTEHTLDTWLADCRANKATDTKSWDHVRLQKDGVADPLQCDIAAYYTKDSPSGIETIVSLFDHTNRYTEEDRQISFVSLAVHELRTPLTIMRGYIEVFEEEFAGKLNDELADFMHKMQASSQQLAAFVNNILNVARIESDQLSLTLQEGNWADIVQSVTSDLSLRAQVHAKTLEVHVAPNIPTVAVDRVGIYEVLANLIDNAIKYSGDEPKKIIIQSTQNNDGMIETTVQDFGVGIPTSVVPNLFERFYRNHRTMTQIGGTGLGLYLSKAIVDAHGGHIWVRSKEGEGSTFGFTLKPFSALADDLKNNDNKDIIRNAHGWIKNHSLYRR